MANPPRTYRQRVREAQADQGVKDRPSSRERGYNTPRWQKYRAWFLRQPNNIMCKTCKVEAATEVDHIRRVSGPNDYLFYKEGNHQALCKSCHSSKTATEDRGFGR